MVDCWAGGSVEKWVEPLVVLLAALWADCLGGSKVVRMADSWVDDWAAKRAGRRAEHWAVYSGDLKAARRGL